MKLQEWGKLREKRLHEPPTKDNVYLSQIYAQLYYMEYGKSLDIITNQGTIAKYQPTKDDIDFSRKAQIVFKDVRDLQIMHSRLVLIWLISVPMCILIGFIIPVSKNELSNQCMQADAAESRR